MINHRNQDTLKSKAVLLRTTLRQPVSLGVPRGYGEAPSPYPWRVSPPPPWVASPRRISLSRLELISKFPVTARPASSQPAEGSSCSRSCGPAPLRRAQAWEPQAAWESHPAQHLRSSSPARGGKPQPHHNPEDLGLAPGSGWWGGRGDCLFLETRVGSGIRLR